MSTRGLFGFKLDGELKVAYNHYDSYPDELGDHLLAWLRDHHDDEPTLAAVRALRVEPSGTTPSAEDIDRLLPFANMSVGSQAVDDWYVLLCETQGDPGRTLAAGVMLDAREFGRDSLFCEWGYVVDFDRRSFDVYKGFRKVPATDGEWAGQDGDRDGSGYWPIQRVASFDFAELPERLDEDALSSEVTA